MQRKTRIIASAIAVLVLAGLGWAISRSFTTAPTAAPAASQATALTLDARTSVRVGKTDAPVTIVTYLDVLCHDCRRAHHDIIPRIQKEYVDTGKVQLHYKMLGSFGPQSLPAATAAYCAHEQGKFMPFIDEAYRRGERSGDSAFQSPGLADIAKQSGVSMPEWTSCVGKNTYHDSIIKHKQEVVASGGFGTPHFIINGKGYNGAPPYDIFVPVINAALAEKGVS